MTAALGNVDSVARRVATLFRVGVSGRLGSMRVTMPRILSADQFVAGVISVLALRDRKRFRFTDNEIDRRFEEAFSALISSEDDFGVVPNFSFYIDRLHGDSACLRDTLLAAREKAIIELNNPTFRTFNIRIDHARAARYLDKNPLPKGFYERVVDEYFSDLI